LLSFQLFTAAATPCFHLFVGFLRASRRLFAPTLSNDLYGKNRYLTLVSEVEMSRFRITSDFIADGLVNNLCLRSECGMWVDVRTDRTSNEVRSSD